MLKGIAPPLLVICGQDDLLAITKSHLLIHIEKRFMAMAIRNEEEGLRETALGRARI